MYPLTYTFSSGSAEEAALVDYLDNGGNLYMEGGDIWCYDASPATLKAYFGVVPGSDGDGDLFTVNGMPSTFTEGMSFSYSGENSWVDHIGAAAPAFEIFTNPSDGQGCAVAHDAGSCRTVAASYEFGGLVDFVPPSTKEELMSRYLDFFGLAPVGALFSDGFESGDVSAW